MWFFFFIISSFHKPNVQNPFTGIYSTQDGIVGNSYDFMAVIFHKSNIFVLQKHITIICDIEFTWMISIHVLCYNMTICKCHLK